MIEYKVDCSDKHRDFMYRTPAINEVDLLTEELKLFVLPIVDIAKLSIDNAVALDFSQLKKNCPRLFEYFDSYNLNCSVAKVLNIPSMTSGWIHSDSGNNELALNIGLENAIDNWNVFYKIIGLPEQTNSTPGQGEPWVYFKEDKVIAEEIGRYNLETPKMFNNRIPHKVVNNTSARRIVTTFRFSPDPDIDKIAYAN
jgi:hypothetical protein